MPPRTFPRTARLARPVRGGWRAWLGALLVAAPTGLVGCASSPPTLRDNKINVYAVGERASAPVLRGERLDGTGTLDLTAHTGDVIVVNFWASWCAPCRTEADDLEQTYQATRDDGVTFLGIDTNDQRDAAKAFVRGRFTYPSVFDPAGRLALGFSVPPTAIPSTIIIDRQGRIAAVVRRAILRSELEPAVAALAAEP